MRRTLQDVEAIEIQLRGRMKRGGRNGPFGSALTVSLPLALLLLSGCPKPLMYRYVDPTLPVVKFEDVKSIAVPRPVQVLVEFRTKGSPNSHATGQVKPIVFETVSRTGLFSEVSEVPVARGGVLTIIIDNVAAPGGAAAKQSGWDLAAAPAG